MLNKITNYFKEVISESKRVNWPTKKEVLRYTLAVVGVSVVLAIFLGGIDVLFTRALNWVILQK